MLLRHAGRPYTRGRWGLDSYLLSLRAIIRLSGFRVARFFSSDTRRARAPESGSFVTYARNKRNARRERASRGASDKFAIRKKAPMRVVLYITGCRAMTGSVTAVSFAISLVESNASTVKYGQGKPVEKSHRNWPLLRRSKLRHRGIY